MIADNSSPSMRAMVLAAGLGKRLRPLTDTTPKPLVKVAGRSLIDYTLDLVRGAGIENVVVNCHYLADQIEDHIRQVKDLSITLSDERGELLETGGGVLKTLSFFEGMPFAVLNSDVIIRDGFNQSLQKLIEQWDPDSMDAFLLMQPTATAVGYSGNGDYSMGDNGQLTRREDRTVTPFLFAGIQILKPSLFEGISSGAFSLNKIYDRAEQAGRLFGLPHEGQWLHVGTEDALIEAEKKIRNL